MTTFDWSREQENKNVIDAVNSNKNLVKVLIADEMRFDDAADEINQKQVRCEGVWVYTIEGNENDGIGFLMSNVMSVIFPGSRGDIIQYRTVNENLKPFITKYIDGKGN